MSLSNKITLLFLAAVVIPSLFIFGVIYVSQSADLDDLTISNLEKILQLQKSRIISAGSYPQVLMEVLENHPSLGETGEVMGLVNNNGILSLALPPRFAEDINEADLQRMLVEAGKATSERKTWANLVDYRGNAVIAVAELMEEFNLVLLAKKDTSEVRSTLQSLDNYFLLAFFVISIGGIFVGLNISRSLADPLRQLSFTVSEFTKNPLTGALSQISSKDETGELSKNFNIMAEKIRNYYHEMEIAVKKRTADLSSVAAQLQSKIAEIESTNKATLNIMADLRAEKENLAEASAKEDAILASIGDGIIATDEGGRIVRVNPRLLAILGYREDEVLGKWVVEFLQLLDLKTEKPIPTENQPLLEALTTGEPVSGTFYVIRKDGTKFAAAITMSPIVLDQKPAGVIEIIRDVTHEIEIDKAKSEFVSLASHQLRTPLSSINWYAEMLLAGDAGVLNEEQRKYLDEIYLGNQRMVELVNSLLNVSRLELGIFIIEPKPTDLVELAESVIKESTPQIQKRQQVLSRIYSPDLPKVNVDVKLMRMIFQNLISNSVKYTAQGGSIALTINKDDKNIIIKVADTGLGIPEDQKEKIFTKLFRADNARESDAEGTGLGLYIIKSILDQSGGKVWFESVENKGTTFYVAIPLSGMQSKSGSKELA